MDKNQFDVLAAIEASAQPLTQRELSELVDRSVGTVNKTIKLLEEGGLISGGRITEAGLAALEPFRVKRAVFLAAGFGSRLVPITLNTPKPLVRVNGTRIIDTLLDAVVAAGIEDIVIVRGYLSEQFDSLLYKYPNIRFIQNPLYNEANNISSAYYARDILGDAYVLEADLVLKNPKLITKYQYSTNYLGVPVEVTDDWCFETRNGYISRVKIGGSNCHHMFGISYWTAQDGKVLGECVKKVFTSPGGKERYWDQVALEYYKDEFHVSIRECTFDDIIEVDTYSELKQLDSAYAQRAGE